MLAACAPDWRVRKRPRPRRGCIALALSLGLGAALTATPALAQAQRAIVNPGFEQNNPGGAGAATFEILANGAVPGWDSTSGFIELWDSGFQSVPSSEGVVFAELNANTAGALFQNMCLISGETVRWRFAHRNRSGGPATQNVSLQAATSAGTVIQTFQTSGVTSTTAWTIRSNTVGVSYTGATGVQRVQFITTDPGSYGNFLDDMSFTLNPLVELDPTATSAAEGASGPTLPGLRITGTLTSSINISLSVTGGTATLGTDYTTPSGTNNFTVTIPAGTYNATRIPLGITIIQDNVVDSGETIQIGLNANASVYTIAATTGCATTTNTAISHTILDDQIVANADAASNVNGASGVANVLNAFTNDVLESNPVSVANITATVLTPATPIGGGPVPTLNVATGAVTVPAGTPAGSYTIRYQICQLLQPSNCSAANIVITVAPSADLSVTKTNTPGVNGNVDQTADTVTFGATVSYTIIVRNAGPDLITGAVVTDAVGTRLNCPASNAVTITGSGVPSGSFTVGNLTGAGITLGTIGPGQSATLTYACQVN
jgi:trimeric autotransporter adhesin